MKKEGKKFKGGKSAGSHGKKEQRKEGEGKEEKERFKRHRGGRKKENINLLITYLALIHQIFMQGRDG